MGLLPPSIILCWILAAATTTLALSPSPPLEITISRLVPTNSGVSESKLLSRFMMDETYGPPPRPFTISWAQRAVLDTTASSDLSARLYYYETSREAGQPLGAIFVARRQPRSDSTDSTTTTTITDDGEIVGFADVGASLWLPNDRAFRLPLTPELRRVAASGTSATDGGPAVGVELRPYLSNLVVDGKMRRCGVGRRLVEACEIEARGWEEGTCRIGGGDSGGDSGGDWMVGERRDMWLEVTVSNEAALRFYGALGYAIDGRTSGSEVVGDGKGGGFRMVDVERCTMRKVLEKV